MKLTLSDPAKVEIRDAAAWYAAKELTLGQEFLDAIESALRRVHENPERWPLLSFRTRRYLVKRFPYALLYEIRPDEVFIVAVMHLRREPNYWQDRG